MTLDQLREKAENAKKMHEEWFEAAFHRQDFHEAFTPDLALALVEYVQAHQKLRHAPWPTLGMAEYRDWVQAFSDAEARLLGLLGEAT